MSETVVPGIDERPQQLAQAASRGYLVTVVGRAVGAHNLAEPPESLPGGVYVELEENGLVLRIPVAASDAKAALAAGRSIADDLFRVLGSSHGPYLRDVLDARDHITRTDAVYIGDGPVPAADVAEGFIAEAG